MTRNFGDDLRRAVSGPETFGVIGVYDVFSATIAAQHFDGIFVSGFGFSASFYGLPDIGFNTWTDIVAFVQRLRTVLPGHCILVDIDDGFADVEVACHVVSLLEAAGASGVILEDQARPRRCGHMNGKRILPLDEYMEKLQRVLQTRRDLFVVARTDASDRDDILRRVTSFSQTDADAVLVDGIGNSALLDEIRHHTQKPLAFNQIVGGASPPRSLFELKQAGVSLAIFSTPCLFAAQDAIDHAMSRLKSQGRLDDRQGAVTLPDCNAILSANLRRRDSAEAATSGSEQPKRAA